MKRRALLAIIGLGIVVLGCAGLGASHVLAATAPTSSGTGQALEIAPPILTLRANPGQTVTAQIQLRDITKGSLVVTNEVNDFVASGEGGTPKILTDSTSDPYSMKDWVSPLPRFTLAPNNIQKLNVTIHVPANASPGGHYGVIRFTGTPPDLNGSGVSLSASLGTLVLLTVNGNLTHHMSISSFTVDKSGKVGKVFQSPPLDFTVRLQNSGNIQEEPSGRIIVSDLFGKPIAGVNINVPPHNVLPGSTRKFNGTLDSTELGNKRLFGLYHVKLTVVYGTDSNQKQTAIAMLTFWIIPYKLVIGTVVGLIVAFFALRFTFRRYNRYIISKAQGTPTKRDRK